MSQEKISRYLRAHRRSNPDDFAGPSRRDSSRRNSSSRPSLSRLGSSRDTPILVPDSDEDDFTMLDSPDVPYKPKWLAKRSRDFKPSQSSKLERSPTKSSGSIHNPISIELKNDITPIRKKQKKQPSLAAHGVSTPTKGDRSQTVRDSRYSGPGGGEMEPTLSYSSMRASESYLNISPAKRLIHLSDHQTPYRQPLFTHPPGSSRSDKHKAKAPIGERFNYDSSALRRRMSVSPSKPSQPSPLKPHTEVLIESPRAEARSRSWLGETTDTPFITQPLSGQNAGDGDATATDADADVEEREKSVKLSQSTDLLAVFDNYQFEAPSPEAGPSQLGRRDPSPSSSPTKRRGSPYANAFASSSRHSASTSSLDTPFPPTKHFVEILPRSTSPTPALLKTDSSAKQLSPSPSSPKRTDSNIRVPAPSPFISKIITAGVRSIIEERAAKRKAAREEAERINEQRRKELEALRNEEDDSEEDEADLDDHTGGLSNLLDFVAHEPSPPPLRRSTRKSYVPPPPVAEARFQPTSNAAILKYGRAVARDQKKGISGVYAEELLDNIRGRTKRDRDGEPIPYPTPDSFSEDNDDLSDSDDEDARDAMFNSAVKQLPVGAVDRQLLRTMQQEEQEDRQVTADTWAGFWKDGAIESSGTATPSDIDFHAIKKRPLRSMVKCVYMTNNAPMFLTLVSTGALNEMFERKPSFLKHIATWLLELALNGYTSAKGKADCAMAALQYLLKNQKTHPFTNSASLTALILTVWNKAGIRPVLLCGSIPQAGVGVGLERLDTCGQLCGLIECAAGAEKIDASDAEKLARLLILLSLDQTTTSWLRRMIETALSALWAIILVVKDPLSIAKDILGYIGDIPLSIQVQTLPAVGSSTPATRNIMRWLAALILQPQLSSFVSDEDQPPFDVIYDAAEKIYNHVCSPKPDHELLHHQLNLFWESMSDVTTLVHDLIRAVGDAKAKYELDQLRACLRAAHTRIQVKTYSNSKNSSNKSRLEQLHVNTGFLFKSALSRWKRNEVDKMRGVKMGQGGQTMLDLPTVPKREKAETGVQVKNEEGMGMDVAEHAEVDSD